MVRIIRERQGKTRVQGTEGATGQLSGSVQFKVREYGFDVGPTVDYAIYADQPTRPHEIRARDGGVLAFPMAGGVRRIRGGRPRSVFRFGGRTTVGDLVYAQVVHHPGTKGLLFSEGTADEVAAPVASMYAGEVESALKELDK